MPATATAPYRILLYNMGYATGLDGSTKNYLLKWYRYLYTPRKIIRRVRQSIYALLNTVQPDLFCFVEVHKRHGFVPHPHAYTSQIDNKYGRRSLFRFLPFFRDNCNGFLAHQSLTFQKRYFRSGSKKLVYDIELGNGLSLLLVHFSLREKTRAKQCKELKEMLFGRTNMIVCGDFNVFKGAKELQLLADDCDLQIIKSGMATFPAVRPEKVLDLFLCPRSMKGVSARVLDDIKESDHLPVMLEIA